MGGAAEGFGDAKHRWKGGGGFTPMTAPRSFKYAPVRFTKFVENDAFSGHFCEPKDCAHANGGL